MRILVIGATGLLGTAVVQALSVNHEVLEASRNGQYKVDLRDPDSITALYVATGPVDAVACAAGVTPFAPLVDLQLDDFRAGLQDKLLGQIEVVRQGVDHVNDGGSFTLVSGVLGRRPHRHRHRCQHRQRCARTPSCVPPPSSCRVASASTPSAPPSSRKRGTRTASTSQVTGRSPPPRWRGRT